MTYDHELTLVEETYDTDEIGNQIPITNERILYCQVKSVGRNEFYTASTSDLRPEIVFVVHRYEYKKERKVIFDRQQYSVIRTYATGFEEIELV